MADYSGNDLPYKYPKINQGTVTAVFGCKDCAKYRAENSQQRFEIQSLFETLQARDKELAEIGKVEEALRKEIEQLKEDLYKAQETAGYAVMAQQKAEAKQTVVHNHYHYEKPSPLTPQPIPLGPYRSPYYQWQVSHTNANGRE